MYSQFVAGETLPAIQNTIRELRQCGIGTMLCVPNEEDLSTDYDNFRDRWACFDLRFRESTSTVVTVSIATFTIFLGSLQCYNYSWKWRWLVVDIYPAAKPVRLTHSFLQWLKYFWTQILQELLRGEQQRTIGVHLHASYPLLQFMVY